MIYLIIGENSYEAKRELASIAREFDGEPEYVDADGLTILQLADIVRAQTLFGARRMIVCRNLSDNKTSWSKLAEWADEVSDDTVLVLLETKPDKRTKAYKALSKRARVINVERFSDRDWRQAEAWLDEYARKHSVKLSREQIHDMVQRAHVADDKPGRQVIDQHVLATAVDALSALEAIDHEAITAVMPQTSAGTVFDLLGYAVARDHVQVTRLVTQLRQQEDPHFILPMLLTQWFQLAEVALVGERRAADVGLHPFVAQKLAVSARDLTHTQLKAITRLAARLDADTKRSAVEPWDAVDRLLLGIMTR